MIFSDDLKNQIKESCEIEQIVQQYVPSLKRAGSAFKGLCPFHKEKTPSFHVFPETQHFYCFGCQKGGDIYSFIMDLEGLDFPGAMRLLGQQVGIDVELELQQARQAQSGGAPPPQQRGPRKDDLYQLHEKLATWYQQLLRSEQGRDAYEYCTQRGLSDELIDQFRLGYAPNSFDAVKNWGKDQGYSYELMLAAGVLTLKNDNDAPTRAYDRWRHRLMFPITNPQGRVVGFSGRVLDADQHGGKYVNSPETPIFHKSSVLYALSQARNGIREHGYVVLCEGQMDAIACHAAGLVNAVAPQGTAFTEAQAKLIKRYTNNVVLCFDSDNAGINAAVKSIDAIISAELVAKVTVLGEGEDPDSIVQSHGPQALMEKVGAATDYFDFLLNIEVQRNGKSPAGKTQTVRNFLGIIAKLKSPVLRSEYCQFLAHRLGLQLQPVFQELNAITNRDRRNNYWQNVRQEVKEEQEQAATPLAGSNAKSPVIEAETHLLDLCLYHEAYATRLESELNPEIISDSPVGGVLNDLLAFTAQGEWDLAREMFGDDLAKYNCPELIRALNQPDFGPDVDQKRLETAYVGCFNTIMRVYYEGRIREKEQQQRTSQDPDEKRSLFTELIELDRRRKQFSIQ